MKRTITISAILAILVTAAWAMFATGSGATGTATTNAVQIVISPAVNTLSVVNTGAQTIFAQVNMATNSFTTTTAVPIPSLTGFTFDCQQRDSITSVCLATTNSTSTYCVGGF